MRLYWPKTEAPSILPAGEGTWQPPGIAKGLVGSGFAPLNCSLPAMPGESELQIVGKRCQYSSSGCRYRRPEPAK